MSKLKITLIIIAIAIIGLVVFLMTGGVADDTSPNNYGAALQSDQPARQLADFNPGPVPVSEAPFSRQLRSVSLDDMAAQGKQTGIWDGSPTAKQKWAWYQQADNYYNTLAAKKVWNEGTGPESHPLGGDITWEYVNIPEPVPLPCDQPQRTGYDAEGCRIVQSLFKDVEKTEPAKAAAYREQVRRGRDVWFKGSFGMQDEEEIHLARTIGRENWHYAEWLDTRQRAHRFTKWGLINDPDCVEGNAESYWLDICQDPQSTGILGYRKYLREPVKDDAGKVVFDPATSPYQDGEREKNMRYYYGQSCAQCHVGFDPTNPPVNPNEPKWANLSGHIGNQHTRQPMTYVMGTPNNHIARSVIMAGREGTIDTSLVANDYQNNPGTQNNITDFMNKRAFQHEMKHPITGEVKTAPTFHILKGGEDSVGDWLALIRVYVNIGMCTEECWAPNFAVPGTFLTDNAKQRPFRINQCYQACQPWNDADAKMPDLAAYLLTGGPFPLLAAKDVDGTPGEKFVDLDQVPRGHTVYARECARCHSTKVPPEAIRGDKDQLERFYAGHVFGDEVAWEHEFTAEVRESEAFKNKYLAKDAQGKTRPKQFAEQGQFGQDWLGNDELTPYHEVGVNRCRAMHDNHNEGHIWEEFASITYQSQPVVGREPRVLNRVLPGIGGTEIGEKDIGGGGPGYYRNISLLSLWSHAPFLHNNALGELTYQKDGTIDYTVKGRIDQFELAMERLLMSDDPNVEPHRPEKITRIQNDITLPLREDGAGPFYLTVEKGKETNAFTSQDPHNPIFMKCSDLVENKGHQFGVDLPKADKRALIEFLKLM